MRILASAFLLVALLLNTFGFYLSFFAQQHTLHQQVSKAMHAHHASEHCITLSSAQFKRVTWLREGKECRIESKLYDIHKIELLNGMVKLHVEEDIMEAVLIDGFINILLGQEHQHGKTPIKVLPQTLFCDFIAAQDVFTFCCESNSIQLHSVDWSFTSQPIRELTPPPPDRA